MPAGKSKAQLSDVLSVLTTAIPDTDVGTSLKYKLQGKEDEEIGLWGHEYVRNLAGEIGVEYQRRIEADPPIGLFVTVSPTH